MRILRPPSLRVATFAPAALCVLWACGAGLPGAQEPGAAPTTGDVFGGKTCHAVRSPTEPKLTAWDADDRAQINALRNHGVVAVRYAVKGCNVELEVLPNCTAQARYDFTPTPSTRHDYIESQNELFADLPLGAAKLSAQLSGHRVLRTDYTLVGVASLASGESFSASQLHGPDCSRATHVVARIYLGGFAMAAGDQATMKAEASLFGAGAGGAVASKVERLSGDGNAEACERAIATGTESPLCSVPLRLGLLPLQGRAGASVASPAASAAPSSPSPPPATAAVSAPAPPAASGAATASGAPTASVLHGPKLVAIPAGTFTMGSSDDDPHADADEKPAHSVTVAAFDLDQTEVTVSDYAACVSAGACRGEEVKHVWWPGIAKGMIALASPLCGLGRDGQEQSPMNCVAWDDARTYCGWAGKRLPTEEEWEYAARGTDGREYPWGNAAPWPTLLNACDSQCSTHTTMYAGSDGYQHTAPVASFPAGRSPFGLHDMAGNVWEWTASAHCPYPANQCDSSARIERGGGWYSRDATKARAAHRDHDDPRRRVTDLGFRCAR